MSTSIHIHGPLAIKNESPSNFLRTTMELKDGMIRTELTVYWLPLGRLSPAEEMEAIRRWWTFRTGLDFQPDYVAFTETSEILEGRSGRLMVEYWYRRRVAQLMEQLPAEKGETS